MNMDKFNYSEAVEKLEKILEKVEDPSTGIQDIDNCIKEADALIQGCRNYLRTARETLENAGR